MIMVRIVSDGLAFSGSEMEAAKLAAIESLTADGIDTAQRAVTGRNSYITQRAWAEANPGDPISAGPWDRALAAAAEALGLEAEQAIDLMPRA